MITLQGYTQVLDTIRWWYLMVVLVYIYRSFVPRSANHKELSFGEIRYQDIGIHPEGNLIDVIL